MKIAVLGSNGFIGNNLFKELSREFSVIGITRDNYKKYVGEKFDIFINANGNSKKYWAENHPLEDFGSNVLSVYKTLLDFKFKKYIYLSTIDTIRRDSVYGFHKYLAEQLLLEKIENVFILKLGTVIGPNLKKGVVYDLLNHFPLWVTEDSNFPLITIRGVTKEIKEIIKSGNFQGSYVVAGSKPLNVKQIAKFLGVKYRIRKEAIEKKYLDLSFGKTAKEYLKEYLNIIGNHKLDE